MRVNEPGSVSREVNMLRDGPTPLTLLAGLCLLTMACQHAAPPAPAPVGQTGGATAASVSGTAASSSGPTRVVVGQTDPLDSQDPLNHTNPFLLPLWCEIAGCLLGWNPKTGEPTPALAESWEVENPTTWIFRLHRQARWQDGSPFTSADVVYSLQAVLDHPSGKLKYKLSSVATFEAVDPYTVRIVTKEPNSQLLDEAFVIGIPMLSKAQHDRGEDLAEQPALGIGPYLLKEWVRNVRVVVAKNPNYW